LTLSYERVPVSSNVPAAHACLGRGGRDHAGLSAAGGHPQPRGQALNGAKFGDSYHQGLGWGLWLTGAPLNALKLSMNFGFTLEKRS